MQIMKAPLTHGMASVGKCHGVDLPIEGRNMAPRSMISRGLPLVES